MHRLHNLHFAQLDESTAMHQVSGATVRWLAGIEWRRGEARRGGMEKTKGGTPKAFGTKLRFGLERRKP